MLMAGHSSFVLLTSAPHISGSYVESLAQEQGFGLQQLTIITSSGVLQASATPQQAFQGCFSVAHQPGHHTAAFLGTVATSLKAGANMTCYEPIAQGPQQAVDQLRKAMLLAGFINLRDSAANEEYGLISVSASKPSYETGAKASVSLKPKQKPKQASWSLAADADDELLDDDDLLTEEDKQRPVILASDCEVGAGKKACKNCTCGRADAEAAVQKVDLTQDMLENPQSACGSVSDTFELSVPEMSDFALTPSAAVCLHGAKNLCLLQCGLGDAFRCASCPYRGLPQFEMGKKIQLGGDFLTADA